MFDQLHNEDILNFNFWPSFTDLMLSLLLIMMAIFFINFGIKSVDLEVKKKSRQALIEEIKKDYSVDSVKNIENDKYDYIVKSKEKYAANIMKITEENDFQQISFYNEILFESGSSDLSIKGKSVINNVGKVIKNNLYNIKEIQIHGHTDNVPVNQKNGNLGLGSNRAISVYQFLKDDLHINPAEHLMSVTSFGEFKPVKRKEEGNYSNELLSDHNKNEDKESNRRIELRIFYKSKSMQI